MVEYDTSTDRGNEETNNVCKEIVNNHRDVVDEMLRVQDEDDSEAWRLLIETPNGIRSTRIMTGKESEIDNDDIEHSLDDFDFPGIKRIIFIHTHPTSGFLSPNDMAAHVRFVDRFDAYEATVGVFKDDGEVEVFAAENKTEFTIGEQAEMNKELEKFDNQLHKTDRPDRFYDIVGEMFNTMEEWMHFCNESYTRR